MQKDTPQLTEPALQYRDILLLLAGIGGGLAVVLVALLLLATGVLLLVIVAIVLLAVACYVVALLLWHLTKILQEDRLQKMQRRALCGLQAQRRDDQREHETYISAENALHVLLVLLSIHQRVIDGESEPWTARALEGMVLLRIGHTSRPVGYLSKDVAAQISNRLAERGLIVGRGDRRAGDYVPIDIGEAIRLYVGDQRL